MADTLGGLVDKLGVVNLKMWNNQELLYELRKMSLNEFRDKYFTDDKAVQRLYLCLQKCCDLNVQRNDLIDEIDQMFKKYISLASDGIVGDAHELLQSKHKSYSGDSE